MERPLYVGQLQPRGVTPEQLDHWFRYHRPEGDEPERYEKIRAAARAFAQVVLDLTPASADQTVAIRKIREAVYSANAAIACKGQ